MAINQINQLRGNNVALPTSDDSQPNRAARVQLHAADYVTEQSDSKFDLSQFQNQFFSDQQRQEADQHFAALTSEDQQRVTDSVSNLRTAVVGVNAGTASMDDAKAAFSSALSTYNSAIQNAPAAAASGTGGFRSSVGAEVGMGQVNDILQYTIGVMENKTASIAVDLNSKIQAKNNIRTEATELGDMISNWPDDGSTQNFQWNTYSVDQNGNVTVQSHSGELTKDQAIQLHEDLQGQLDTMDDITQMQQFDLQQKYQDQQQAMTTLSQILSSMHDTMKNTINNTKAG